jgi:flagella basal body P-ring formation protein FlgA
MIKLILFFVTAFAFVNASHAEPQWQTHESIYEAVKAYVAQNINTTAEYEINIVPLASRLNLALCQQPMDVFTPSLVKAGRVAVNVRCGTGKKWAIFVPVIITPFENIVVLTQNMQHGDKVTENHVALARKNVMQLHSNYLTDITQVINKQIAHNLPAGTVITQKDLFEAKLIKRGDHVMMTSSNSGIAIRMSGVAQSDGSLGQVIRVKNQNSERTINAIVVDAGVVNVLH